MAERLKLIVWAGLFWSLISNAAEVPLGKMDNFYRGQAVLGENWSMGGLQPGGDICKVPDYLMAPCLDFPYRKKAVGEELMFADRITAVRFLGGIDDAIIPTESEHGHTLDLVWRADDGSLQYRWSALDRFDRYVDLFGSEITVVLDNIPYAFPDALHMDGYGQTAPPADYDEWTTFIRSLCNELVRRYGRETVEGWRFRMCTEARIETDTAGFCRHYELTTSAIHDVLPNAEMAPYNSAVIHRVGVQHINFYAFLDYAVRNDLPFDFAPVSYYSVPLTSDKARGAGPKVLTDPEDERVCRWTVSPELRSELGYKSYWDRIDRELGRSVPREIQELGIIYNEQGDFTSEPGARGAAWLFHFLFHMKEVNQVRYAWHWHITDPVSVPEKPLAQQHRLLRSNGWLYSMFDYTVGADLFRLDVSAAEPDRDLLLKCIGFKDAESGASYVILSALNMDRDRSFQQQVSISIPQRFADLSRCRVRQTCLNDETDVYMKIRRDLEREGLVNPEVSTHPNTLYALSPVQTNKSLATVEGKRWVDRNWNEYEAMIQQSLMLKPWQGTIQSGELNFFVQTPSVTVICIERERAKDE